MTQIFQISLDEVGRIHIPGPIHERLNLLPGMTFVVEKDEKGGVQLRLQSKPLTLVEKDGVLVARVIALSDLADITRHERDRRVFDLLQRSGL